MAVPACVSGFTNDGSELCGLTGSVLCSTQPLPLRVALHADDVQAVSLLQSEVGLTASAVRTSLRLVDGFQGPHQLTHTHTHTKKAFITNGSQMNKLWTGRVFA